MERGLKVRITAPGALQGTLATVDVPVSATRWRVIAKSGMWSGKPFTVAEDYLERVQ